MNFFGKIPNWAWLTFFCGIALIQVWLTRNTVMGDAFIHFVFARGITEGQPFCYNGDFSAGSTSPLWSMMLSPLWLILGEKIIWGVKFFTSFFVAFSVPLTFLVARKISQNKNLALIASALMAGSYVLSFWASKGMETPFYVCLVLINFLIYLKIFEVKQSLKWEIILGCLLGLTILTRPEGWFLAVFLGIPLVVKKNWRVILTVGIPASLILSPYYFLLWKNTGGFFPSSAARVLRAQQWAYQISGFYFSFEVLKILFTKFLFLTPFLILFSWREKMKKECFIFFPILAWLVFHIVFFSVIFPTTEGYRYILTVLPFIYIISLLRVWNINSPKIRVTVLVFILLGSFTVSGQQLQKRMTSIKNCESFINSTRKEAGIWLKNNTSTEDLIALKEIDQTAFYSGRRVLSIDGTLNTTAVPFVQTQNQLGLLQRLKPNYFVLEEEMYREYPDWQNSNLIILADKNLNIGASKILDNLKFTLLHKIKVGDEKSCTHFSQEYFWWIFEVKYF